MTEKLINLVKCHPILYDLDHEDYKSTFKKDKIWNDIGDELDESGETIKKRWKNIRDSYAKYLRAKGTRTGPTSMQKFRKWQWADQMESIRPFMSFSKTESNIRSIEEEIFHNITTEDAIEPTADEETKTFKFPSNSDPLFFSEPMKRKKAQKKDIDSSVSAAIEYPNEHKDKNNHPIDLMFSGYAETVKMFCWPMQIVAKKKVAELMLELEIENQKLSATTPSTRTSNVSLQHYPLVNWDSVDEVEGPTVHKRQTNVFPQLQKKTKGGYFCDDDSARSPSSNCNSQQEDAQSSNRYKCLPPSNRATKDENIPANRKSSRISELMRIDAAYRDSLNEFS